MRQWRLIILDKTLPCIDSRGEICIAGRDYVAVKYAGFPWRGNEGGVSRVLEACKMKSIFVGRDIDDGPPRRASSWHN